MTKYPRLTCMWWAVSSGQLSGGAVWQCGSVAGKTQDYCPAPQPQLLACLSRNDCRHRIWEHTRHSMAKLLQRHTLKRERCLQQQKIQVFCAILYQSSVSGCGLASQYGERDWPTNRTPRPPSWPGKGSTVSTEIVDEHLAVVFPLMRIPRKDKRAET